MPRPPILGTRRACGQCIHEPRFERATDHTRPEPVLSRASVGPGDFEPDPCGLGTRCEGRQNDGGDQRQFGWGRFSPTLRTPHGAPTLKIARSVRALRLYNRPLRTSEAVGNFRAGPSR